MENQLTILETDLMWYIKICMAHTIMSLGELQLSENYNIKLHDNLGLSQHTGT